MDSGEGEDGQRGRSTQGSTRRPRAPTITIDTSAVNSSPSPGPESSTHQLQPLSHRPHEPSIDFKIEGSDVTSLAGGEPNRNELRPAQSFDSKDSRPISPHNVSSPSKFSNQPQNFLSVPNARSRGNSVDSDEVAQSPTSYGGDTFIPSPTSSQNGDSRRLETAHSNDNLVADTEALQPDPGNEADFQVENNPFAFSPGQLNKLLNPKSLGAFHALGGLRGIEKGLRTDSKSGLSVDENHLDGDVSFEEAVEAQSKQDASQNIKPRARSDTPVQRGNSKNPQFSDRKRVFSDNTLPEKKAKSIFELAWLAYNDKVLILLTVAAVVSLAVGIYQSVDPPPSEKNEAHVEWVEGVAIVVAIVIVVIVGAGNDWQKERQFVKLNKKKEDRMVRVVRSGKSREISVHDVLVGDLMHLEPGDMIPVDGIFVTGHNVLCDESSATGESDLLRKTDADRVFQAIENHGSLNKLDPFIISGAKVNEGVGTFLVTATGINSSHGKTMMSLREDAQTTPLQVKLNMLAEYIAKLGLGAGLLLFVVTFIEFLVRLNEYPDGPTKAQAFLNVFIVAVTIVVVAVPEGLPLAVTLALAFATTRMLKDNNLVRLLRACETMGNATTICSDKTGTLTQNKMSVVAGIIGTWCGFGGNPSTEKTEVAEKDEKARSQSALPRSIKETVETLDSSVLDLMKESVLTNSTAFEGEGDGPDTFVGSKTETALLSFCRDFIGMGPLGEERSAVEIVQVVPFDSSRKCMATVIRLPSGKYRMHVKGASEIMLGRCVNTIRDPTKGLSEMALSEEDMDHLKESIETYASRSLRTIGIVYKEFDKWPPRGVPSQHNDPRQADFDVVFKDMTLLGIVGIQDPLRDGVTEAVKTCQGAGVIVRMVTGDNISTAKAIATECGIYTPGGIIMEGPQFRRMTRSQMCQTIPRLQVLARSSPEDKRILAKRLREMGETVAVTGDGTNDAPALKTADVGFSMGIAGTEVAKEASAIILMDDNFASIVKAMMWGRAVNDAVKKFLQFQVTVNITAVVLTFVSAVASSNERSVLTAVQLLWVNLIMDTFAALALATDPASPSLLDRKPEPKSAPLITITMWKMIIGQSIYQLIITIALYFAGPYMTFLFSSFSSDDPSVRANNFDFATTIFNTFVWMQIFNQYNCRRIDNKLNIFEGAHRNFFFIGIQFIIVAAQVLIVFKGGQAFSVEPINGTQWGVSLILGLISIPIAIVIRFIPDAAMAACIPKFLNKKRAPEVFVSDEERQFEWDPAFDDIKADLAFLKMVRGGRLNMLKYKISHPREFLPRSRSNSRPRSRASSTPHSPMPQTPVGEPASDIGSQSSPRPPATPDSHLSVGPLGRKRGRSRSNSAFGPAAAMAGIVAGSIGGWHPVERKDGGIEFAVRSPVQGRSDLEGQPGVEVHPDTSPDYPVLIGPEDIKDSPPSQQKELSPATQGSLQVSSSKEKELNPMSASTTLAPPFTPAAPEVSEPTSHSTTDSHKDEGSNKSD